jgi:hypothetical protein
VSFPQESFLTPRPGNNASAELSMQCLSWADNGTMNLPMMFSDVGHGGKLDMANDFSMPS